MAGFQPHVFGNYYLLEHIAYGGMAEIYRAKSFGASGFERELVLKRVIERLTENPDFLTMLVNEAKITATLQHGNIAQVFELGLVDGVYFITMEYVEGISLKDLLTAFLAREQLPTPLEAAYIAVQMAQGLDYAHRKSDPMGQPLGIVHCDVSPDNAILSYDGNLKVVDFGIARAQASVSNYKEGMVMGKYNYVAPEQAMGRDVDCRADIFSTGIILYELLTGEHPFGRKGDVDTLVRIAKFAKGEVKPPEEVRPEVPSMLSAIVMKALAHDREERYPSSAHLADALLSYLHPVTPAQVHQHLAGRIQKIFGDRVAERRRIRSEDEPIIRELNRQRAGAGDAPSGPGKPSTTQARAPLRPRTALLPVVGGLALVLGVASGFFAGREPPAKVLFVRSDPPGATVRLERAPVGNTPLVVEIQPDRAYLLMVEREGFEPYQHTFVAGSDRIVEIAARLEPKTAGLEIVSEQIGRAHV